MAIIAALMYLIVSRDEIGWGIIMLFALGSLMATLNIELDREP